MSEFGSGVVVPLVKFGAHLNDRWAKQVEMALAWSEMSPIQREKIITDGGDEWGVTIALLELKDIEEMISMHVQMWANGASDHLADVDLTLAPESLLELRRIMFELRYEADNQFTTDDWAKIRHLYREAAMDIDEKLVGTNPDWGDHS